MKDNIDTLISALYSRATSKATFIKEYFKEVPYNNEYVLSLIEKGISKDAITIEEAILLLYVGSFDLSLFSGDYVRCYNIHGIQNMRI